MSRYALSWVSADRQHSMPMGSYPTREAAETAIPVTKVEALAQCHSGEERDGILAGTWEVSEVQS